VKRVTLFILSAVTLSAVWYFYPNQDIDFNTQVKPILNKKCIACHGGVRRKSGFSVLFRQEALAPNESGKPAIIPGNPEESELIRRIIHNDPEERMPYRHEPLSKNEIETLRQWIKEGAAWGNHFQNFPGLILKRKSGLKMKSTTSLLRR
jgi:hypothetical protein